jgi:NAD(P)-dependent dehydrogenase (short-subunit alcohol dehydrogenase family)
MAEPHASMAGKICLVTGGIGYATARELARRGAVRQQPADSSPASRDVDGRPAVALSEEMTAASRLP